MSTRHNMLALAVSVALGAPAAAQAQDFSFNYLEGGFIAGFVNDVEEAGAITGGGTPLDLETDAGGGAFIAGAWEFGNNLHLFGMYSANSQDLEVSDGVDTVEGDFDVVQWRIGVGYAYPYSPTMNFYGRLSFDNIEFKDVEVAGFNIDADVDDDGIGGELGMTWAATPTIHLQGHARYTSVGELATDGSATFDSDILFGVNGRWYVRPDIALVTGYELGKITLWNLGVRFAF